MGGKTALRGKAIFMLLLTTVGWGLSFPLMKAASLSLGTSWEAGAALLAWRFTGSALILFVLAAKCLPLTRLEWRQGVGMGLAGGGGMLLQADGLQYTLASTSAFLTQFTCVLVPLWIVAVHRKAPSLRLCVCVIIVLAGIAILSGFDASTLQVGRGELETLAATVLFMGMILWLDRPLFGINRSPAVACVSFSVSALLCWPVVFLSGTGDHRWLQAVTDPRLLLILSVLTVVGTALPFWWMIQWQPRVTATEAGIIYCAEPISASLAGLVLPAMLAGFLGVSYGNETVTLSLLVGGGLVTLANVILAMPSSSSRAD